MDRREYLRRWRREHPRLQLYMSREEYEELKEIAQEHGVSLKQLVLRAIRNTREVVREAEDNGFAKAIGLFVFRPREFYGKVLEFIEIAREIRDVPEEVALFTVPCCICRRPMVFTHADDNWVRIRRDLREAFRTCITSGVERS